MSLKYSSVIKYDTATKISHYIEMHKQPMEQKASQYGVVYSKSVWWDLT